MNVRDPGHVYELAHLDGAGVSMLVFVKREGEKYPGNVGHHEGTNLQEVVRVLIDRLRYLDAQIPHEYNERAANHLRNVLILLELRAADRHGRRLRFNPITIEQQPTCARCGHIGCGGIVVDACCSPASAAQSDGNARKA